MLKSEFVRRVAEDNGYTYSVSQEIVTSVFNTLKDCIKEGNIITISGLGKFDYLYLGKRTIKNPVKGIIEAGPRTKVVFYPNQALRDSVTPLTKEHIMELNPDAFEEPSDGKVWAGENMQAVTKARDAVVASDEVAD